MPRYPCASEPFRAFGALRTYGAFRSPSDDFRVVGGLGDPGIFSVLVPLRFGAFGFFGAFGARWSLQSLRGLRSPSKPSVPSEPFEPCTSEPRNLGVSVPRSLQSSECRCLGASVPRNLGAPVPRSLEPSDALIVATWSLRWSGAAAGVWSPSQP